MAGDIAGERLMTGPEVAALFRVDPGTICRWAKAGLLPSLRTPGGKHYRYRESDVRALLAKGTQPRQDAA